MRSSEGAVAISRATALSHVAGYSVFNDGSIRDYQLKNGVPKAQVYSLTMYIMCAFLLIGLICNICMRPVNPKYHHTGAESAS